MSRGLPGFDALETIDRRVSAVEHATAQIREAILAGSLRPGALLPIGSLSNELGVSAIPIREALRTLDGEGLIELRPNREAVVAPISLQEIGDIFAARKRFEAPLFAGAAGHLADVDFDALDSLRQQMSTRRDPQATREAHGKFHEELLRPATTTFDRRVLQLMWDATDKYFMVMLQSRSGHDLAESHSLLIEALRSGSARACRDALFAHYSTGLNTIRTALTSSRSAP